MAKIAKTRLPKTVAGVKVPKALRKAGLLDSLISSDVGRKLLADALIAAAGAAAAALVRDMSSPTGAKGKSRTKTAVSDATHAAAGAVAAFVTDAAKDLLSGLGAGETPKAEDGAPAPAKPQRKKAAPKQTVAKAGPEQPA